MSCAPPSSRNRATATIRALLLGTRRVELDVRIDPARVDAPIVEVELLRQTGLGRRGTEIAATVGINPNGVLVVLDDFLFVVTTKIGVLREALHAGAGV